MPIGRLFVDLSVIPALPPRAKELGLDGVRRVEGRWGIQDKACVMTLGVDAPGPARSPRSLRPAADQARYPCGHTRGSADYTLLSIDPGKFAETILNLVKHDDPDAAARLTAFAQRFRDRTGLSLRDDLLAKIGPRMALIPSGRGIGSAISFWFHPPDLAVVAELKTARGLRNHAGPADRGGQP